MEPYLVVKTYSGYRTYGGCAFLSDIVSGERQTYRWSALVTQALRFELSELCELLDLVRGRRWMQVCLVRGPHLVTISERYAGESSLQLVA